MDLISSINNYESEDYRTEKQLKLSQQIYELEINNITPTEKKNETKCSYGLYIL